jgi:hypothetical protein
MPSRSIVRRAAPRGRDHAHAFVRAGFRFFLDRHERGGVDRFDLRHDDVRAFLFDQRADRGAVEHVEHVAAMRDLHGRRMRIAIGGDDFHAEALQLQRHFLAEFARAEQEHARGMRGQRSAERRHGGHGVAAQAA